MSAKASALVQLPESTPLRRTRSQAQREAAQAEEDAAAAAAAAAASSAGASPAAADAAADVAAAASAAATPLSTPIRRRTRASVAAAAALGVPLSPVSSSSRRGSLSSESPSLRERTSDAIEGLKHSAIDAGNAIKQSCSKYQLIAFDHCPEWLKDNRYIRSGYRANIGWRHSVESVCHMHNETINVWTHIVAFLIMTMLLVLTMSVLSPHGVDRLDLDVVLSPRPVGAGSTGAQAQMAGCDAEAMAAAAAAGTVIPACVNADGSTGPAASVQSDDPLAVLHNLLGDDQDEMLVELVSRVQALLPNLQSLTSSLKEKAAALQDSVMAAMPEQASRNLRQLRQEGSDSLAAYMQRVEKSLDNLKAGVADLAGEKVAAGYGKLRDRLGTLLRDFSRDFSPDLLSFTSDKHLDLVPVTRAMLQRFMAQAHLDHGLSFSAAMQQIPGLQVQVEMNMGTPSIFGLGQSPSSLPAAAPSSNVAESIAAELDEDRRLALEQQLLHAQSHAETRVDADGGGKSVHTSIGYMAIDLHTRASAPGSVTLQLHSYLPRYPLAVFLVTAMLCLLFSSVYHLMHAVSGEWARRFQALDYAGIVLLIAGSTTPIVYYAFFCRPVLKWAYIAMVWVLAIVVFTIVVLPMYRHQRYRVLKTVCFIALGFSGTIPLMHFQYHLGYVHFITLWLLVMGACYLVGAAIYVTQVPERWWPGAFDFIGSSHQLWHLSIFAAVLVHYVGLMHMFEWRMARVCSANMFT